MTFDELYQQAKAVLNPCDFLPMRTPAVSAQHC